MVNAIGGGECIQIRTGNPRSHRSLTKRTDSCATLHEVTCIRHITSLEQYTTPCLIITPKQETVYERIPLLHRL